MRKFRDIKRMGCRFSKLIIGLNFIPYLFISVHSESLLSILHSLFSVLLFLTEIYNALSISMIMAKLIP
jgi:hypothetical protein